ncbi:MAG: helix-turn-helix domain-containing protein, partial [Eisenbergiella massiliensis]
VVNLSASYLSFVFKENSGLNFVDYVNQFRLRKAKELLENTSYNISQIAELVGYSSANSFSKVFKKYNGISPAQYRKI